MGISHVEPTGSWKADSLKVNELIQRAQAAVAEMLKARETAIDMIVAVGEGVILPPCGRCRELLAQVDASNLGTQVILPGKRIRPLRELLPEHWLITE